MNKIGKRGQLTGAIVNVVALVALIITVTVGVIVRIEYGGKKPVKGSKGLRTFHAWNVYYKKESS